MRNEKQKVADRRNLRFAEATKLARRVVLFCKNCGESKSMPPSVANRGWKFCSTKCRYSFMYGENAPNANGGEWMRGTKNPNYKDGTGYDRHERHRQELVQQWRRRVYARDKFTCQKCGYVAKKNNSLNAHHIKPWKDYPNERFSVDNGITLCRICHKKEHQ